jgi:hypothetical protein
MVQLSPVVESRHPKLFCFPIPTCASESASSYASSHGAFYKTEKKLPHFTQRFMLFRICHIFEKYVGQKMALATLVI